MHYWLALLGRVASDRIIGRVQRNTQPSGGEKPVVTYLIVAYVRCSSALVGVGCYLYPTYLTTSSRYLSKARVISPFLVATGNLS